MAALPGYSFVLRNATTDATGDVVNGIDTVSPPNERMMLPVTAFSQSEACEKFIAGLFRGATVQVSGHYLPADTGQARFSTLLASGAACYVRFLFDGSTGIKVETLVAGRSFNVDVTGVVKVTYTLQINGVYGTV